MIFFINRQGCNNNLKNQFVIIYWSSGVYPSACVQHHAVVLIYCVLHSAEGFNSSLTTRPILDAIDGLPATANTPPPPPALQIHLSTAVMPIKRVKPAPSIHDWRYNKSCQTRAYPVTSQLLTLEALSLNRCRQCIFYLVTSRFDRIAICLGQLSSRCQILASYSRTFVWRPLANRCAQITAWRLTCRLLLVVSLLDACGAAARCGLEIRL